MALVSSAVNFFTFCNYSVHLGENRRKIEEMDGTLAGVSSIRGASLELCLFGIAGDCC